MPDKRRHRGPHPKDADCFQAAEIPRLQQATDDYCWLLSHGYPPKAALSLVGNRFSLRDRQRRALQRCGAGDESCRRRRHRQVDISDLEGKPLAIDGYNALLTVEAAFDSGVLLLARDGVLRDLASMSRHYRSVQRTRTAIEAIGEVLALAGTSGVTWFLDRPVSNSGRLRHLLLDTAADHGWPWQVELSEQTDRTLIHSPAIVASADSAILDRCQSWFNLARLVVAAAVHDAWIIDLSTPNRPPPAAGRQSPP